MKKVIAREVLMLLIYISIIGSFYGGNWLYKTWNEKGFHKAEQALEQNKVFLQQQHIQAICFSNGKYHYTVSIEQLEKFVDKRKDLKAIGKKRQP